MTGGLAVRINSVEESAVVGSINNDVGVRAVNFSFFASLVTFGVVVERGLGRAGEVKTVAGLGSVVGLAKREVQIILAGLIHEAKDAA